MASSTSDHNLLLGILALQRDFISRDHLVEAFSRWREHPEQAIDILLLEQGALTPEQHLQLITAGSAQGSQSALESYQGFTVEEGKDFDRTSDYTPPTDPHATVMPRAEEESSGSLPWRSRFSQEAFHAAGGLGEVYKAQDAELGRQVALKRMKAQVANHPDSQRRFVREAKITGRMEHPGIVPVYGLVHDQNGQPSYAMRFIEGDSLKHAINKFHEADKTKRDPGERSLALRQLLNRFLTVCNTIGFAHNRGIIHRDVKPANIMLGPYGETLVVDWGLARSFEKTNADRGSGNTTLEALTDVDMDGTQMGQIVGTPAYMSPEQAAGRWDLVGPASDLYSLGATLYTLLTGTAPFSGDKQAQILQKVMRGEFPPPRKVKPNTPKPLEAICLKAMALKAEERHASALEIAADLEHWLADEPVAAYRDPLLARMGRWLRRHKPLVAAAMVALVVLCSVTAWWYWDRSLMATAVTSDLDSAEAVLRHDQDLSLARVKLERAEARMAGGGPGALQSRLAGLKRDMVMVSNLENAYLQGSSVTDGKFDNAEADRFFSLAFTQYGLGPDDISHDEAAQVIRSSTIRTSLVIALDQWEMCKDNLARDSGLKLLTLAQMIDDDPWRKQLRTAIREHDRAALERLALDFDVVDQSPAHSVLICRVLWEKSGSRQAERLLRRAQRAYPADFWINFQLARTIGFMNTLDKTDAVRFYQTALALRPGNAVVYSNLGGVLIAQGKLDEAEAACRKAVQLQPDNYQAHFNLGGALREQGRFGESVSAYKNSVKLNPDFAEAHNCLGIALYRQPGSLTEAVAEYRKAIELKSENAGFHHNLGLALSAQGKNHEALSAFKQAIKLKSDDAESHYSLGNALSGLEKWNEAAEAFMEAIRLKPSHAFAHSNLGRCFANQNNLVDAIFEFRKAITYKHDLIEAHNGLGNGLVAQNNFTEGLAELREAIRINPNIPETHNSLGVALDKQGRREEASGEYKEAIKLRSGFVQAHINFGTTLLAQGKTTQAIFELREAIKLKPNDFVANQSLGMALYRLGKHAESIAVLLEAIKLKPDFAEGHLRLGFVYRDSGHFSEGLKELQRGHELGTQSPGWAYPSDQWIKEVERLNELDLKLAKILKNKSKPSDAKECISLAQMCRKYKQLYAESARFYEGAFAGQPELSDDLTAKHRYNAACSAALAGTGQGKDSASLDNQARILLRRQSLEWLRADLDLWIKQLANGGPHSQQQVRNSLLHWQRNADLEAVRDKDALAKLPEMERETWKKLWDEVEDLHRVARRIKTIPFLSLP